MRGGERVRDGGEMVSPIGVPRYALGYTSMVGQDDVSYQVPGGVLSRESKQGVWS